MTSSSEPPGSPEPALLDVLEAAAENIRLAAHLARGPDAFAEPAEAYAALRWLASIEAALPQVIAHAGWWLEAGRTARRIGVAGGEDGAEAFTSMSVRLHAAKFAAKQAALRLSEAAEIASRLETAEGDGDG